MSENEDASEEDIPEEIVERNSSNNQISDEQINNLRQQVIQSFSINAPLVILYRNLYPFFSLKIHY